MMQQLFNNKNETGAYLPIMAIGIVMLLGIAALSVDGANMFYTKLQYKKATDAAVVAALEYRVQRGYHQSLHLPTDFAGFNNANGKAKVDGNTNITGTMERAVIQRAREIAKNNVIFALPKFKSGAQQLFEEDFTVNYDSPNAGNNFSEVLNVQLQKARDFLLMSSGLMQLMVGGSGNFDSFTTTGVSTGDISPMQVIMMLDFSNSMVCPISEEYYEQQAIKDACTIAKDRKRQLEAGALDPSEQADIYYDINQNCHCGCLLTDSCPITFTDENEPNGNHIPLPFQQESKLSQLIQAVDSFLEKFRPGKDIIGIILFNGASYVFKPINEPFTTADINFWNVSERDPGSDDPKDRILLPGGVGQANLNSLIQSIIDRSGSLRLGDWTNVADALLSAYIHNLKYNSVANNGADVKIKTHYVLFSDGAPSATRLILNSYTDGMFTNGLNTSEGVDLDLDNDWTLLSILTDFAKYSPSGLSKMESDPIWSPTPFLRSQVLLENPSAVPNQTIYGLQVPDAVNSNPDFTSLFMPGSGIIDPLDLTTYLNFWPYPNPNVMINLSNLNSSVEQSEFKSEAFILDQDVNLGQILPNGLIDCVPNNLDCPTGSCVYARGDSPESSATNNCQIVTTLRTDWVKLLYDVPLWYSEVIRNNNGIIHTIGIGTQDSCVGPSGCKVSEQLGYQNYLDAMTRKDYLLGRIAGRSSVDLTPEIEGDSESNIAAFTTPNLPPIDEKRTGTYQVSNDSRSLSDAFDAVADEIIRLSK